MAVLRQLARDRDAPDDAYHCSDNVNALCEADIPALVADNQMR